MNRGNLLIGAGLRMVVEDCFTCGTLFAMTEDLRDRFISDHNRSFYCPNGHSMHYTGKTDTEKLRDAQARETALRDQLDTAVRDAENTRHALARDRHRFANGVCPCCNRSFDNVRRHMAGQHPDYDVTTLAGDKMETPFECSCGAEFESFRGLRTHQGHVRPDDWTARAQAASQWKRETAHTTVV